MIHRPKITVTDLSHLNNLDRIVHAICVCKGKTVPKEEKDKIDLVNKIIKMGHTSVLEHGAVKYKNLREITNILKEMWFYNPDYLYPFFMIECDVDVSHQIVRHRVHSFTERSKRSCLPTIWWPNELPTWIAFPMEIITRIAYNYLNKRYGMDYAKKVLPACTRTILYMSGPLFKWDNYIKLRTGQHTQFDHKKIAMDIQNFIFKRPKDDTKN